MMAGDALLRVGAAGFEVADRDTDPTLGDEAVVTAWIPASPGVRELADLALGELQADAQWEADPGWAEAWREHFRPVKAGSLTIRAPWNEASEGLEVVIEPAMAFGTGGHATTRLAMEALEGAMGDHPGEAVLDVGTGSGVLAIAAVKLGASQAFGVDVDPVAVDATADNAVLNGVTDRVRSDRDWPDRTFAVVVANIISPVLLKLSDRLVAALAPGGTLVLSGVLAEEADEFSAAFRGTSGLLDVGRLQMSADAEWVCLTFRSPRP
jgi:ribosomal protein L11 methyltransferase